MPITLLGAGAVAIGVLLPRYTTRLPEWLRRSVSFAGSGIVLAQVALAGANDAGEGLFWIFCFAPVAAFVFFPWRWAVAMMAWVMLASGIAVFGLHVMAPIEWYAVTWIGLTIAAAIRWLVDYAAAGDRDSTTGMLNRRGLGRELTSRCLTAQQTGRGFSLAWLTVQPSPGTSRRGADVDLLARRLASGWLTDAPTTAAWARIADLEFAVLWDGADGLEPYLHRISDRASGEPVAIGFCDWHPDADPTTLMNEASEGCAYSLQTGGAVTRTGLVHSQVQQLRTAIEQGRIVAHYQPVVDLRTNRVIGAEALARWVHPTRGLVPPDEFIPLAEHAGLIGNLGEHILRQACCDAAAWHTEGGAAPTIAVNVSGCQLQDASFPDLVDDALARAELPADRLTLEVTESTLAADDPVAHGTLARLRTRGVSVAIDDFGTGYSSMSRLAALPIDILKIDRTFVQQLNGPGAAIISCLLALAEGTGLRTVIEGIETAEEAQFLIALGAEAGQGWLYGRAVPAGEFPLGRPVAVAGPATSAGCGPSPCG